MVIVSGAWPDMLMTTSGMILLRGRVNALAERLGRADRLNQASLRYVYEFEFREHMPLNVSTWSTRSHASIVRRPIRNSPWQIHQATSSLDYETAVCGELLQDRKSTRLNSSHIQKSRMPSSA